MGDYNSRYMRNNITGGYVYDELEIEKLKQQQVQDVIDNDMLGDFNSEGHYVVDKSIINELITTTKVITSTYGDFKFCQSTKKFDRIGNIQFAVDFSSNPENGQAVAVLILLESMRAVNGYIENTNGVSIARFVGNNDKSFVERALKYFYVFLPDQLDGATFIENEKDIHHTNILSRLAFLRSVKVLSDPLINKLEKDSYKRKSKSLTDSKSGKEIYDEFDQEKTGIEDKFLDKSKPEYYKLLNSLLDKTLEKFENKVDEDGLLKSKLRKIDEIKTGTSKEIIDKSERETVSQNLSKNADKVYSKKSQNKLSKGASPVAVFREPKKSYEEIEQKENAKYTVRDHAKNSVKENGAKLFNKNKVKESDKLRDLAEKLEDKDSKQTEVKNQQEKPKKLSTKPSFVKNDRYEEIKQNEQKGEKLKTNPSIYSRGKNQTNENVNEVSDDKVKEKTKGFSKQQTNANVNFKNNEESVVTNLATTNKPTKQNEKENLINSILKNKGQTSTNNVNKENQQTNYNTNQNQSIQQNQQNPNLQNPNYYNNTYNNQHPYYKDPLKAEMIQQEMMESKMIDRQFENFFFGTGMPHPMGMGRPPMGMGMGMGGPRPPMPHEPVNVQTNEHGHVIDIEPMSAVNTGSISRPGPIVEPYGNSQVETNETKSHGVESNYVPHVDPTPVGDNKINQEELMKQIFGKDIYELTRNQEATKTTQQTHGQTKTQTNENEEVFAHVFVKH